MPTTSILTCATLLLSPAGRVAKFLWSLVDVGVFVSDDGNPGRHAGAREPDVVPHVHRCVHDVTLLGQNSDLGPGFTGFHLPLQGALRDQPPFGTALMIVALVF